jgi:hypothetical protein
VRTLAQDKRLWLGGVAVVAALIVLLGWFFLISPELSDASSIREQAESAESQNMVLQAKNAKLKNANDNAAALRAELAAALAELPADSGLAEFTRQLSAQAAANGVTLSSVVVGSAAPFAADTADAPATTTDTAAATASTAALVAIPITVVAIGPCAGDIAFLQAIQVTGPRRALVSDVLLAPATGEAPCTLTAQLSVFSAPLTPEAVAALEKMLSGG